MKNDNIEILVSKKGCSSNGAMTPIKQYYHEGNIYVEAREGVKYEVKIKNTTYGRVLATVSVDGLDVLNGKSASENSGGYVLSPYESYNIKGFRVSNEEVNLFEFSAKEQSYAAKSPDGEKSTQNCGVIALRIYQEKPQTPAQIIYRRPSFPKKLPMFPSPWDFPERPSYPYPRFGDITCSTQSDERGYEVNSRAVGGASYNLRSRSLLSLAEPEPAEFDMGTKFSKTKVEDKVSSTQFEKGNLLTEVNVYYASRAALKAMGVRIEPETPKVVLPKAFKDTGFCRPPE